MTEQHGTADRPGRPVWGSDEGAGARQVRLLEQQVRDLRQTVWRQQALGPVLLLVVGWFLPLTSLSVDDGDDTVTVARSLWSSLFYLFRTPASGISGLDSHPYSGPIVVTVCLIGLVMLAVGSVAGVAAAFRALADEPRRPDRIVLRIAGVIMLTGLVLIMVALQVVGSSEPAGPGIAVLVLGAAAVWVLAGTVRSAVDLAADASIRS